MRIDIISVQPDIFQGAFSVSILKRAQEKGIVHLEIHNLRDFATNKHKNVDDYQYGGGAGMVLSIEPIANCIDKLLLERKYDEIIFMTPDGELLNQSISNQVSLLKNVIILCGHYKGVDERVRKLYVTKEISIGSYVLSGGELPAAVFVDSIIRLIPGVLNDETSALSDSFQDNLLAPPVYTRPMEFRGEKVPDVLLSGNFKQIEKYREEEAIKRTKLRRPDLL